MKILLSFFPRNCEYTDDSFVIVDVRDEDEVRFDGQIKGPVLHIPSGQFSTLANAKDILRENKLLDKRTIAVHCHKSQQRGPYCARILSTAISELSPESENYPEIRVLRYGYEGFFKRYSSSENGNDLIHNPLRN
jgi:rhodanese-related sulfurtransferase